MAMPCLASSAIDLPQLGEPGQVTGPVCHIYFRDHRSHSRLPSGEAPAAGLRAHTATVTVTVMGAVARRGEGPLMI